MNESSVQLPIGWNQHSTKMFYLTNTETVNQRIIDGLIQNHDSRTLKTALKYIPKKQVSSSFLLKACKCRSYRCLKVFLEKGILPKKKQLKRLASKDGYGITPFKIFEKQNIPLNYLLLSEWALKGPDKIKKLDYFIRQGEIDVRESSLVYEAVFNENIKQLKYLIDHGGNVNDVYLGKGILFDSQETPLHLAVRKKNRELVKVLLKEKADPNLVNKMGQSSLFSLCTLTYNTCHTGMQPKYRTIAYLLLANRADPNQECQFQSHSISPIDYCLKMEKLALLRPLVKYGGDPKRKKICTAWLSHLNTGMTGWMIKDLVYCTRKKISKDWKGRLSTCRD